MGKYAALQNYLGAQGREHVPMTFADIERVTGIKLPASKLHRAWWSNNPDNNVMTKEWLAAGYVTRSVDIAGERLVFQRTEKVSDSRNRNSHTGGSEGRHGAFGCMKGLLSIAEGHDVTEPTSEEWGNDFVSTDSKS